MNEKSMRARSRKFAKLVVKNDCQSPQELAELSWRDGFRDGFETAVELAEKAFARAALSAETPDQEQK